MLEFLKSLFASKTPAAPDPEAWRRFAGLVLTEVKLQHPDVAARLRLDPALVNQLLPELRRAYQLYAARADGGPEARKLFSEEAVRILANGDAQALEPALSIALRSESFPGG